MLAYEFAKDESMLCSPSFGLSKGGNSMKVIGEIESLSVHHLALVIYNLDVWT